MENAKKLPHTNTMALDRTQKIAYMRKTCWYQPTSGGVRGAIHVTDMNSEVTRKITISEILAAAAFILSASSLLFTGGVVYGQTQDNTRRMSAVELKLDKAIPDIARMEADIRFLVQSEMARQERNGQFEYRQPPTGGNR